MAFTLRHTVKKLRFAHEVHHIAATPCKSTIFEGTDAKCTLPLDLARGGKQNQSLEEEFAHSISCFIWSWDKTKQTDRWIGLTALKKWHLQSTFTVSVSFSILQKLILCIESEIASINCSFRYAYMSIS